MLRECPKHGLTEYVQETAKQIRCKQCRVDAVTKRRRKVRKILVAEAGGCCKICGYNRCADALEFHHTDPNQKDFALSGQGMTRAIAKVKEEAKKCILLCANCHREVEAGFINC